MVLLYNNPTVLCDTALSAGDIREQNQAGRKRALRVFLNFCRYAYCILWDTSGRYVIYSVHPKIVNAGFTPFLGIA